MKPRAKLPTKAALLAELAAALAEALATAEAAYAAAIEGATHGEARPENDKDTRALEQSYVARGQAMRVDELRTGAAELARLAARAFGDGDKIASGALVTVEDADADGDAATRVYLIAPAGGGTSLAGGAVQVVTPRSPLGRALCGKVLGDDVEVALGGANRTLSIAKVG